MWADYSHGLRQCNIRNAEVDIQKRVCYPKWPCYGPFRPIFGVPALKNDDKDLIPLLERIANALEALGGIQSPRIDLDAADAFVWHPSPPHLQPVPQVSRIDLPLLHGIDRARDTLIANTRRFSRGLPANNALLWGARGMGKSSLVKAAHAAVAAEAQKEKLAALKIIEIHREDIETLPGLLGHLRDKQERIILFCDDLSFDAGDTSYKSLKAALEGGIEGRPDNVIFYATSNRRHLIPRDMIENERSTAINPSEAVQEKVSLSDRFGLWLGFHNCSQDQYLQMIQGYFDHFGISESQDEWRGDALEWSTTRGSRSGRVAWQYVQDYAGRNGVSLN